MHNSILLAVLVGSVLTSAQNSGSLCAVAGLNEFGNPYQNLKGSAFANLQGCGRICTKDPACKSFAYSTKACMLFTISVWVQDFVVSRPVADGLTERKTYIEVQKANSPFMMWVVSLRRCHALRYIARVQCAAFQVQCQVQDQVQRQVQSRVQHLAFPLQRLR